MSDERYERFYETRLRPFAPNLDGRKKLGDAILDGEYWSELNEQQKAEVRKCYDDPQFDDRKGDRRTVSSASWPRPPGTRYKERRQTIGTIADRINQ